MFLNPCAGAPGNGLLAPGGLTLIEGQGLLLCYLDPAHQWALDLVWGVGTDHSPWAQGSEHAEGPSGSGVSLGFGGLSTGWGSLGGKG